MKHFFTSALTKLKSLFSNPSHALQIGIAVGKAALSTAKSFVSLGVSHGEISAEESTAVFGEFSKVDSVIAEAEADLASATGGGNLETIADKVMESVTGLVANGALHIKNAQTQAKVATVIGGVEMAFNAIATFAHGV